MGILDSKINEYAENLDKIPQEYMDKAYEFLKDYCTKNNTTVSEFTQDENEIKRKISARKLQLASISRKPLTEEDIKREETMAEIRRQFR